MNTKIEFIEHVSTKIIKCAIVINEDNGLIDDDEQLSPSINLLCGYTSIQYDEFIEELNFEYDAGYGGQKIFGTIWYEDGTWSDRGEYDGSEWWDYHIVPTIPEKLHFY